MVSLNEMEEIENFLEEVLQRVADSNYDFVRCPTRLDRMGPYHKQDVVAALIAASGTISLAAQMLGRSRARLRDYIYRNPDVLIWFDDQKESKLDVVEHNHMAAAVGGNLTAGWQILTTLGKDRGYSTRSELGGLNGEPLAPPTLDFTKLSVATLKELQQAGMTGDDG